MFDVLVESTRRKTGKRASRYFVVTTAIYAVAIFALGVGTIIGFSPALAEEYNLVGMLAPPVPMTPSAPQPEIAAPKNAKADAQPEIFAPAKEPVKIPDVGDIKFLPKTRPTTGTIVPGLPPGTGSQGCMGCVVGNSNESTPPPPPPPDIKKIPPTPTPEVKQGPTKVSEGVLQGSAIRKQRPTYPPIAKAARVSGPVQVVVTISEDGKVIDAYAADGNPMLRQAAVDAARQWLFTPTTLSKVPVKVQGVLTFNFVLQ